MRHHHIIQEITPSAAIYDKDIAAIAEQTIARHGETEWRCALLTLELHGHIGIYALLGVKMGLYARELMGKECDSLHVVSYGGSQPPISCMNDGLQVATESTLGHGLIEILHPFSPRVEAEFNSRFSSLRLRLKGEYKEHIESFIADSTAQYGKGSRYWETVRHKAIECWREWDRKELFEIE